MNNTSPTLESKIDNNTFLGLCVLPQGTVLSKCAAAGEVIRGLMPRAAALLSSYGSAGDSKAVLGIKVLYTLKQ